MSIEGGRGVRRLMENSILKFHFVFLNTSLIQFLGHHSYTKTCHLEQVIRCGFAPEPDNICTSLLIRMAIHYSMGITVTQKEICNLQLYHLQSDMVVVRAGVKVHTYYHVYERWRKGKMDYLLWLVRTWITVNFCSWPLLQKLTKLANSRSGPLIISSIHEREHGYSIFLWYLDW